MSGLLFFEDFQSGGVIINSHIFSHAPLNDGFRGLRFSQMPASHRENFRIRDVSGELVYHISQQITPRAHAPATRRLELPLMVQSLAEIGRLIRQFESAIDEIQHDGIAGVPARLFKSPSSNR